MIQNVILTDKRARRELVVAGNNTSDFVKYLTERLKKPVTVNRSVITGIMNNYDARDHQGVVFRGDLVSFLWDAQDREVSCEIR